MIPRKYTIISKDDVASIDFDQVLEGNESHLHYSLDGSKTLVKYRDGQPSFLWSKTEYTHEEILEVLATDEWTPPDPE
jgi:uncharacterized protein YllA (UPF0747 family)